MIVAPLPAGEGAAPQNSLRDIMGDIDNDRDFHTHIISQKSKVPPKAADIRYEQHPVRNPEKQCRNVLADLIRRCYRNSKPLCLRVEHRHRRLQRLRHRHRSQVLVKHHSRHSLPYLNHQRVEHHLVRRRHRHTNRSSRLSSASQRKWHQHLLTP